MGQNTNYERDLVLDPSTFAYVQDRSQGEVGIYVGPFKVSLGETDQPVVFDPEIKRFVSKSLDKAIQGMIIAPESWYVIIKNPALQTDGSLKLPGIGKNASKDVELTIGRKINVSGPVSFPLWPGQMASVVKGHHLRSNQYLLVRVYDEEAATNNRGQAVIKSASDTEGEVRSLIPEDLSIGKLFIIRGTDASFFIPPTGIEVVKGENGEYIRDAETLEVLEYCILLDEDGNKRFVRGPDVVFPEPTESFVTKRDHKKFTAFELNDKSGLYIKVIKDYKDKNGVEHKTGEELFITGVDTPVYFPREEHAIIKYDSDKETNFAVAVPVGEGRYVLNRKTGEIKTIIGPSMFLPDPREEVLIRRVLPAKEVQLMYPNNQAALNHNAALEQVCEANQSYALSSSATFDAEMMGQKIMAGVNNFRAHPIKRKALKDFAGDEFSRGTSFTPPRMLTIENKFDGVVTANIWTGYAVKVVDKQGNRRVEVGPTTIILQYDEALESFSLSTGCPKTQSTKIHDVYLRCLNNRVTDVIRVQTKDLVDVSLKLSYRVNFTGDPNKWFDVDDYVGLLTDHMRSVLRNTIQQLGIEEFWDNKIDIIRDCVLGAQVNGDRTGRVFEQNGMSIVDIDFSDAKILDSHISASLVEAQHEALRMDLELKSKERELSSFVKVEQIKRDRSLAAEETAIKMAELNLLATERAHKLSMARLDTVEVETAKQFAGKCNQQQALDEINKAELMREKIKADQVAAIAQEELSREITVINAKTEAEERRIKAVTPDLIAAMTVMGQSEFAAKLTEELSPLAILGGESVAEVAARLLGGLGLDKVLETLSSNLPEGSKNEKIFNNMAK
jgi:major vault protein